MTDSAPRSLSLRDLGVALSLANLSYVRIWGEILGVTTPEAYFMSVANADVLAVMVNVLLLAAVFLAATYVARGFGRAGRIAIITGFTAVIVVRLNDLGPTLSPGVLTVVDRWRDGKILDALAPLLVLAIVAALIAWRPQRARRIAVGFVLALSPFVAVTFARGAWILLKVDPSETLAPEVPEIGEPVRERDGPRVVVMLMDALSRYHAVDARPALLALPEFDRLRAESIDATQVEQIGWATKISVPAMITGLRVTDSDPADSDELLLTLASGRTQPWSEAPTLFSLADSLGGVAVIAGWYHPYCRMFPQLDGCVTYPTRTIGSRGRETGFLKAVLDQQLALIPYVNLRIRQVDIVEAQRAEALDAVTTGDRGLVFLHMIVPHTPWIWDETTDTYTVTRFEPDGYYGNIRLMDRILGELRAEMEAAGKWDSTAVLLLSDHVMRYRPKYLKEPDDRRVPFILKMPGATTGLRYERPLSAMITHDLVRDLLIGRVRSAAEAVAWLDARADARASVRPATP